MRKYPFLIVLRTGEGTDRQSEEELYHSRESLNLKIYIMYLLTLAIDRRTKWVVYCMVFDKEARQSFLSGM